MTQMWLGCLVPEPARGKMTPEGGQRYTPDFGSHKQAFIYCRRERESTELASVLLLGPSLPWMATIQVFIGERRAVRGSKRRLE